MRFFGYLRSGRVREQRDEKARANRTNRRDELDLLVGMGLIKLASFPVFCWLPCDSP